MNAIMGSVGYISLGVPRSEKHLSYDEFFELHSEKTITVAALIAMLQKYDPEAVVCHSDSEDGTTPIEKVYMGTMKQWHGIYTDGDMCYLIGSEMHTIDVLVIS